MPENPFRGSRFEKPLSPIIREGDFICRFCKGKVNRANLKGKNKNECPKCGAEIAMPKIRG